MLTSLSSEGDSNSINQLKYCSVQNDDIALSDPLSPVISQTIERVLEPPNNIIQSNDKEEDLKVYECCACCFGVRYII